MKSSDLFNVNGYGVIITGGASGLGLAFTEVMAMNGARVTMLDINEKRIKEETERLQKMNLDVTGEVVDIVDHAALDQAFENAHKKYGRLDVVFVNAGIDPGVGFLGEWEGNVKPRVTEGALENYTDERWNRVIEVNLNAAFATVRAAARYMKPQKSGRIIITTSMAATHNEPSIGSAYATSKGGLRHFMHSAALELAGYNITVNAIAPGNFVSNLAEGKSNNPKEIEEKGKIIPMRHVGTPEELKGLALYLASPSSGYLTGQEILVDGGVGLRPAIWSWIGEP